MLSGNSGQLPPVSRPQGQGDDRQLLQKMQPLVRTEIPVHVVDLAEIVRGEFHENVARKDFQPSEMVAIAKALEPEQQQAARERQGTRTDLDIKESFLEVGAGQTRDKVAAYVGVSGRTLEKAAEVVEAARWVPVHRSG